MSKLHGINSINMGSINALGSGLTGRGSGHPSNTAYDNALKHIKSDEFTSILPFGLDESNLDENKVSIMQYNNNKLSTTSVKPKAISSNVGRASQLKTQVKPADTNGDMMELVKSIIKLLVQIVTNTDQLNNIVKLLGDYVTTVSSSDGSKASKETALLAKQNLINAMQGNGNNSSEPSAQLMRLIEATEKIARE
jgi:hypothetical protein